jgi:predicted RNA methylase
MSSPALAAAPSRRPSPTDTAAMIIAAARLILPTIEQGGSLNAPTLRTAMEAAFGATDAGGAWDWKTAYEACEVTQILFLQQYGPAMLSPKSDPLAVLAMLDRIARLFPTQTRRSEESQAMQQFSTPMGLAYAASVAAAITPDDAVLEPSAGTGLLASFASLGGASLILNELARTRAALLGALFPGALLSRHDAAQIDDHLGPQCTPSVVLMNPPFSVLAQTQGKQADATLRHIGSALARLCDMGRLVAITGANFTPQNPRWRDSFIRLQESATLTFTAEIDGKVFARHGTTTAVRLLVFDKLPAPQPDHFIAFPAIAPDVAALLRWIGDHVPPRAPFALPRSIPVQPSGPTLLPVSSTRPRAKPPAPEAAKVQGVELDYTLTDWSPDLDTRISDALYEGYALQTLHIPRSQPHPTKLVQSAAMASVAPPKPTYRPHLPAGLVEQGLLSDAQLESLIYAGEAHSHLLGGHWHVDETYDKLTAASEDTEDAVQFRQGWFLGDGTGAGKGRQVAGIILDNMLKGRKRAVWISKSDKLIEDAKRDWSALGQERLLITPLSRFRQGTPITLAQGILFATYATLRSDARANKLSRVAQIVEWLGSDFDGVIVFDESHAMQNAAGGTGERGDVSASQQGRAGLRLQHALPLARIVYVSATGATSVQNLAYAQRLGLWGGENFPFATRADFVQAIEAGGVAAMEVLARDLKALGSYAARSLSYEGVEYDILEHILTPEQTRIYDAYAGGFQIIHNNLDAALEATHVTGVTGTLNAQAKSVARSAFESAKQRFFNHLITAMKAPTLIASIEADLAAGHACVIQIVSTGEALMERRLAEIDPSEWDDLHIDITPREYVLDYLAHSFPVQLFEPFADGEGNLCSRPVFKDGQPVICREAARRRDAMIEKLAALAPVQGALDQIIQRFGTAQVAEVTGRSRRIVRIGDRLKIEGRAANANLAETSVFMDDKKRILIFSDAGGTGRSYHADMGVKNQRLRVHYLLEAGWKADTAIQGLGRTNRTNQAQPPLFRPIASNVKAEKRFLSTIARRLDTLGAITRGQRQTGGQGLFRAEDNLESQYARDALRQLYCQLYAGKVEACPLQVFESMTGLRLTDAGGGLKDELPPITTFLNRLLALTIRMQNLVFGAFEELISAKIESAVASGTYDVGLETLTAESFSVIEAATIYTHPGTQAETRLLTINRRDRNMPLQLENALRLLGDHRAKLLVNKRSKRAAVQIPTSSALRDDGEVERRIELIRPMDRYRLAVAAMPETHWEEADQTQFAACWTAELATIAEFADSRFHIVTGLLLPIWKRLPAEQARVYRLQTDDGTRIIGRKVSPAWAASAVSKDAPTLAGAEAIALLTEGKTLIELAEGLQLRRSLVMHVSRIELTGFADTALNQLKAAGLMSEIIAWKLRLFVPLGAAAPAIIERILARYPVVRLIDRMAA